jgi:hypothetical protein
MVLPWMLGLRWAGGVGRSRRGMPVPEPSLGLAAKVALDEIFFATEVLSSSIALRPGDRRRVGGEISEALASFRQSGWTDRPVEYHREPPPLERVSERRARSGTRSYAHLSFESGYAPRTGEPGRARWLGYLPNRTAHAWVLRHEGAPRPWVVCVPGYRMGAPLVDFAGFRAGWLHRGLGLNVAVAVLPFHGPRRVGRRSGDGFLAGDLLDTIHAQAQAVWDLRRLIGWIRLRGAPAVGAYGVSLGGYTVALLASLEERLDTAVAGIPASCFIGLARSHAPPGLFEVARRAGFPLAEIEELMRVVSPLAMPPRVPRAGRYLYAGTADRLATPDQAWNLWRHWERPRIAWYHGSHVSFLVEPAVGALLREALHPDALLRLARERNQAWTGGRRSAQAHAPSSWAAT